MVVGIIDIIIDATSLIGTIVLPVFVVVMMMFVSDGGTVAVLIYLVALRRMMTALRRMMTALRRYAWCYIVGLGSLV